MAQVTVTVWPVIVFLLLLGLLLIFGLLYPTSATRRIVATVLLMVGGAIGAASLMWVSRSRSELLLPLFGIETTIMLLFFALVVLPG